MSAASRGGTPRQTKLEQQLAGDESEGVTPLDVFREARRRFLRMERLDMSELATDMGVSRATLYRWVGSREQLLAEVIWSLAEVGLRDARAAAEGLTGVEWVLRIQESFGEQIVANAPVRFFVDNEPATAIRVMTSKDSPTQARVIDFYREVLEDAAGRKEISLRMPAQELAYVIVRMANAFLWTNLIAGEAPDIQTGSDVTRALLA
jgi:AcrR family transcriptional regulator